jgi:acetate kinase
VPAPGGAIDAGDLRRALRDGGLGAADAVGHRIVHGGTRFRDPVRIDGEVAQALRSLAELAPLHQRKALAALDVVSALVPGAPAVACFDTAFHATLPAAASTYALPEAWRTRHGARRYGFHGLSHAWIARRVAALCGESRRIVSAHLGAGASLCAIAGGCSCDTTMGFTPLEGLVMATRSGSVDPGLILWLLGRDGLAREEIAHALEHESGLLGLSGSADMRELLAAAASAEPRATLALDVYVHRLRAGIAAMAAALGGLDVLAFTGGVGERAAEIRARAAAGLAFLGVAVDPVRNRAPRLDADVSAPGAPVATLVIRAREDLEIARQARGVLAAA